MTRVIIMAGGEGRRWNNYLGVPKHLIVIDGETLLARQIRQMRERGLDDITICGPYEIEGTKRLDPRDNTQAMEFELVDRDLGEGRVIVLLGDVYYTDHAMDVICDLKPDGGINKVDRPRAGRTWDKWGELWAIVIDGAYEQFCQAVREAKATADIVPIARKLLGKVPGSVVVNDETNDFDHPSVYLSWMSRRKAYAFRATHAKRRR